MFGMDQWNGKYVIWFALISFISIFWHLRRRKNSSRRSKLPPGPRGWPIFGNLFDLGSLPHRSLEALRHKYGPVVWLNLGSTKTMVLLSRDGAEEMYKNQDLTFVDRYYNDAMTAHDYNLYSMAFGAYENFPRSLRKTCLSEIFTKKRIVETQHVRQKCVEDLLSWIENEAEKSANSKIVVRDFVFPTLFNMLGNLTISRNMMDPQSEISSDFFSTIQGFTEGLGRPNISDVLPWLKRFDLQGVRRTMDRSLATGIRIMSVYVKERVAEREKKTSKSEHKDFLDVLLDYRGTGKGEPDKLSEFRIAMFLMDLFVAGTETSTATVEWAMSELLQNPHAMNKIKSDLAMVVGANEKLQDKHLDNLPYLHAILQETLRRHPPAPLLLPRKAVEDTNFMGYSIPKGTRVIVNYWAISRNEEYWEDALSFKPERFLDSNITYRGQNFEFIPFGSGRRICPGVQFAHHALQLTLGSLIHHFDWELPDDGKIMDMMEDTGASAAKKERVVAIAKPKTR